MKDTMNEEWKRWTLSQIEKKINVTKIQQSLVKQNYSPKCIYEILGNVPEQNMNVRPLPEFTELNTFTKNNFITEDECKHFIDLSTEETMSQSKVAGQTEGFNSEGRTGTNCWILHNKSETTLDVANRIANLVNIPLKYAESFQVVHYNEEEEYRPHYDGWKHDNSEKSNRMMKKKGQRLCTCLVYLNTPEEGGATIFPKLKKEIAAEQGKLLFFNNVEQNTHVLHPDSLHGGAPVIKGEKWAFNLWFRERALTVKE